MKLIIDTNVVLDVFLKREPFFTHSYEVLKMSASDITECIVSASAVTDIYYLLNRNYRDAKKSKEYIHKLTQIVTVADVVSDDIQTALMYDITDFEDAIVTAVAVRNKAEYIITRNAKDFVNAPIKAVTPEEFLLM